MKYFFKNPRLKRSWPLTILAILYMLIPIINLPISVYFYAPEHWTEGETWRVFFANMVFWSRVWGIAMMLSGALLLIQRRITWLIAVLMMLFSAVYTWKVILPLGEFPAIFKVISFLSIAASLLVLSHFKFPYLDTRDYWFGVAHRFTADNTGFPIQFVESVGEAEVIDISITGARLRFKGKGKTPSVGDVLHIKYRGDLVLKVIVRRLIGEEHGVEFDDPNSQQKKAIKRLIRELSRRRNTFVLD